MPAVARTEARLAAEITERSPAIRRSASDAPTRPGPGAVRSRPGACGQRLTRTVTLFEVSALCSVSAGTLALKVDFLLIFLLKVALHLELR
jgi:hypothetical protein